MYKSYDIEIKDAFSKTKQDMDWIWFLLVVCEQIAVGDNMGIFLDGVAGLQIYVVPKKNRYVSR